MTHHLSLYQVSPEMKQCIQNCLDCHSICLNTVTYCLQHESMMMSQDLGAADDKFDLRFLDAMIPHHEGALVMAKDAISKSTRPEVKQLNQNILTSQQAEITQMQQWRKAWYN